MDIGVFKHVTEKKNEFRDDSVYYQFNVLSNQKLISNYEDLKSIVLVLNSNEKLKELIFLFLSNLELKDRTLHFKKYKLGFIGFEAVNWISKHFDLSRSLCLKIGEFMRQIGIFKHITDEDYAFTDDYVYFVLSESCFEFFERVGDSYEISKSEGLANWTKKLSEKFESVQEFTTIPNLYKSTIKKDLHSLTTLMRAYLQFLLLKHESRYTFEYDLKIFIGNWCVNKSICQEKSLKDFIQINSFKGDIYAIG
jgi:hypothetical protein